MNKVSLTKPVVLMLYGLPGAGKTLFARGLTDMLNICHVHTDKLRSELFVNPRYDQEENSVLEYLARYMSEEFLKAGVGVIYDHSISRTKERREVRELAQKHHAKVLTVWFQIDPESAFARTQNRDRRRGEDKHAQPMTRPQFDRIASRMQKPEPTEDYCVISGKHTFNSQKNVLIKELYKLGVVSADLSKDSKMSKPGLINLIPNPHAGRVDQTRRNIRIS